MILDFFLSKLVLILFYVKVKHIALISSPSHVEKIY